MVADGVYACGKSKKITKELLKTDKNLTLITLAGKNEKLFKKYNELKKKGKIKDNINFVVLPFVDNINIYYKVADVFVTKAGPNAILDSVFMGTPIIVDYYAHPIEKATKKLFVDNLGMGKAIYNPKKVRKQIEKWIDNPTELHIYEHNTGKIDKHNNGSIEVSKLIHNEAKRKEVFGEKIFTRFKVMYLKKHANKVYNKFKKNF